MLKFDGLPNKDYLIENERDEGHPPAPSPEHPAAACFVEVLLKSLLILMVGYLVSVSCSQASIKWWTH